MMSETLSITLPKAKLDRSGQTLFEELYKAAASHSVPPSTAMTIRLVFREPPHGTTIEPFIGSASFQALLRIPKKRDDAHALLCTLIATAFYFSPSVGVLLLDEGASVPNERVDVSLDVLRQGYRLRPNTSIQVMADLKWFHFSQVEAKLLQPLNLETEQHASHYLRDFWVRAAEPQTAHDVVVTEVAKDGAKVISFGRVAADEAPPQAGQRPINVVSGGRIYFSDLSK